VALILHIETSTTVCSIALAQDGKLISLQEINEGYSHAENITLFIERVLKDARKIISNIDAVAVSIGPGSYTGLRIGLSTAKGLCYALDKPLIAISTLKSLTVNYLSKTVPPPSSPVTLFCPMIDARRMEVYCCVYDTALNEIENVSAKIIDENSFADLLSKNKMYFFGDGAVKCKGVLGKNSNAVFIDDVFPSSSTMVSLAEEKFKKKEFENVSLVEPFYLKEYVAGKDLRKSYQ
jgi:tRNA threonylcarbamoyladenosine biosynthesis protein TsaB